MEAIALCVTRKFEHSSLKKYTWRESFKFGYVSTFKLFVSQSTNYIVTSISVRVVLFACYMLDIVITSIYGGGLASILTQPRLEEVADSVERLHSHKLIWAGTTIAWTFAIDGSDEVCHLILMYLQRIAI